MLTTQTIYDAKGVPAFAVIPFAEYEALISRTKGASKEPAQIPGTNIVDPDPDESGVPATPQAIMRALVDGATPARAWREYMKLTQAEVAKRMGITQQAYADMETAAKPRKPTRQKIADALGLHVAQLDNF